MNTDKKDFGSQLAYAALDDGKENNNLGSLPSVSEKQEG